MSRLWPKMSRSLPKIEPTLSPKLPRAALLKLFAVETITGLEKTLKLTDGTLSKAMPEYPTYAKPQPVRGLSALAHQTLLNGLAERFSTGEQMRAWMNRHWPAELLSETGCWLEMFYENLDLAEQVPQMGVFPTDYLERPEKAEILRLLLTSNPVQVLWLTGSGGTGKSTLALSLVRLSWAQIKRHYKQVFWVNLEQANYEEGLRQLADSLDLVGESVDIIEQMLRSLSDKQKGLFILDDVSTPADLTEWRQLAGTQGKLVVTSRTRLAENELHADGQFHQIQLGGFSLEQSCQFFEDTSPAMAALFEQTGGLPLALRILSALKLELGYSAQEIQLKLEQFALEALESPTGPPTRGTSLRFCFGLSYQALVKSHPQAAHYFECAGIFKSRMMLKTLLDDVAEIDNLPTGDKLTAILLRYNLVDVLNIKGERFIQLHPLLYEFAQEKLASSASAAQVETRYPQAISDWVFQAHLALENGLQLVSVQQHRSDLLQALLQWIRQNEWPSAIALLDPAFEFVLLAQTELDQGHQFLAALDAQLPAAETAEMTLFHLMLLTRKADLVALSADLSQARPLWSAALALQKELQPPAGLEAVYWQEVVSTHLGLAKCLQFENRLAESLELLRSAEASLIFEHAETHDPDFLIAELLGDQGEHAQALTHLQLLQAQYVSQPPSRIEENYLRVRQADCHFKLGQLEPALELYAAAFADEQSPPLFRAEYGLSLAGCLESSGQWARRDQVLETVEGLMAGPSSALFEQVLARVAEFRARPSTTDPE